MDAADKVLELLQEARGPVSGEHMAQKLGVTRNTVWKAVKHLREAGYEISAVTNQGYRLLSESDVLSAGNIRRQLEPQASIAAIDVRESVTSTNTVLKELAEHGGREGMVVIAQRQTMGKGRLGRSFYSPQGGGLYMSVLLRPRFSADAALSITTAAAVAVARAIDDVTGERAMIKWVNDVYFHGRKVCGILTEASVDFENSGLHYAVLGMGVNLTEPEGGFPGEVAQVAGALFAGKAPAGSRPKLAAAIPLIFAPRCEFRFFFCAFMLSVYLTASTGDTLAAIRPGFAVLIATVTAANKMLPMKMTGFALVSNAAPA